MRTHSFPSFIRLISCLLIVACTVTAAAPLRAQDDIFGKWEEIGLLRAQGQYEKAASLLRNIIIQNSGDERVVRRAWNLLVHTIYKMGREKEAMEVAREAIAAYPDLSVDPAVLPDWMNDTYDELRSSMYGSLSVTGPEGAKLFLDGDSLGVAPLKLQYLRTGNYELTALKKGYYAKTDSIRIDPSEMMTLGMSLTRARDARWWLYRIGPVVAAGILAVIGFTSGSDGNAAGESPLPGPPDPPGN
jgi:tetratricopeptide (TPR) repeat protein